ncbi:MAG: FlgD immunoglobulin-like domain containing protein [Candidatus Latescibacterota bacterium]
MARRSALWALILALCVGPEGAMAQQGYRLRSGVVEVGTQAHWQAWQAPAGLAVVAADGTVMPAHVDSSVNAVADAAAYTYPLPGTLRGQYDNSYMVGSTLTARGGIKRTGSNAAGAAAILDGDPATSWEPDAADAVGDWWVEVDLGRVVCATRVVVRFAQDDPARRADPFLQFRVHTSGGQSPFGGADQSGTLDYTLVGGTSRPNKEQRLFEFEATPLGPRSAEWTGRLVQYLRISATDSDLDHAGEVTAEEHAALRSADRGAVEHLWRVAGEERVVSAQRYAELPAQEQGGIRYYRRERPRLADVEVWTAGEDIGLGILARGGSLRDPNSTAFPERAFDGRLSTDWNAIVYSTVGDIAGWGHLTVDLGALFRLRAVRPITRVLFSGQAVLYGYELRGSDGSRAADGSLIWQPLSGDERLLNQSIRLFEDRFEPRNLRYLEFRNLDVARRTRADEGHRYPSVVSEIQIYALGYSPELVLTSGFIDLQQAQTLTTIEWDAATPPGTAVQIRSRTGDELREVTHWYNAQGQELPNQEAYDRLPSFARGETVTEVLAGPGWSAWSQAYLQPGEPVRSPSPRRYLMLEARLLTADPEAAAALSRIRVGLSPPVAQSVVAEIHPQSGVPLGQLTVLEVFVHPQYGSTDPRVDRVRLVAPSLAGMALERLGRGTPAELAAGRAEEFVAQADGGFASPTGRRVTVAGDGTDTLTVALPAPLAAGEVLRLWLATAVYQSGATFQAAVGNRTRPGVWQPADPGDAVGDELSAGEGMTVLTPLDAGNLKLLGPRRLVVTPNGDGANDVAVLEFAVLRVSGQRRVEVGIYNLAGRCLRRFTQTRVQASGRYAVAWDGAGENGTLVAPGTYVARIAVPTDGPASGEAARLICVAY